MTYYSRCLTGLVAFATGLGFVFAGYNRVMPASSAGQAAFGVLAAGAYLLLAGQAMLLTCDCVSLEKREGTLGLLFLTDLGGFDVVAGKLAAQVSRSFYCLLAALPAFGFCIVLGGVGLGDFVIVALGLLNTLFFFAALGLLISVCVWSERAAIMHGGLALLGLGILLPILGLMLKFNSFLAWIPAGAFFSAPGLSAGLKPPPNATLSLLVPHAMGWLFIGAASWLVPRSWTPAAPARPARPAATTRQRKPPAGVPTPWATALANPLLTTALLAILCAIVLGAALLGTAWMKAAAIPGTILLLHSVLKYEAASQAGRMLAGKRRSGELELLLTTPCDEDEILRGCFLQLKRGLFWPVLFALGVDLALLIAGGGNNSFGGSFWWTVIVMVEIIWMLANLYSLSWVGLFQGLKLANPAKAAGRAIFNVVLLPWVSVICCAGLAAVLTPGNTGPEVVLPIVLVFVCSLTFCNVYFTGSAISELRDRFRAWAARG
jgi:hypothetical protein